MDCYYWGSAQIDTLKHSGVRKLPKTFLKVILLAPHRLFSEKKICSGQLFLILKSVLKYESSCRPREAVFLLAGFAACVLMSCYIEKAQEKVTDAMLMNGFQPAENKQISGEREYWERTSVHHVAFCSEDHHAQVILLEFCSLNFLILSGNFYKE